MPHTVTVGLDGTRESLAAVGWAAREALSRDVPMELVQVRETGAYPYSPIIDDEVEREWAEKITSETTDDLTRRYPDLRTTTEMPAGRPAHVLSELSDRTDLLVLGSRGLSSVIGYLVGSTALPTVAHAHCPVVLVRPEAEGGTARPGDIILGMDLNRPSDELMNFAFDTASRHATPLRVLNAWGDLPPSHALRPTATSRDMSGEQLDEHNQTLSATLHHWEQRFPDVEVEAESVIGHPARLLVDVASEASLVVVGRHIRRSHVGAHIGPITHAVMHHARAPVAVVAHG